MDKWKEVGTKVSNFVAKMAGWFFIYAMVVFMFGLCLKTTQWVLSMMGVF